MQRTLAYAAISLPLRKQGKDEAQRSIRTFYEAVKNEPWKGRRTYYFLGF
jgi:hypothetical protein